MKLAVLYAGQGAQHPGMGKEFYEASSAFRAAFDAADLPFDLHRVCFDDPDGVLNQTEYTQPCMVAFACGVTAVLAEKGVKPAYLAGLSLGEYSALEAAGVFTAKQAIELAAKVFCNEGDTVICENPTFIGALNAFRSNGARTVGVSLHEDGPDPAELEATIRKNPNTKLLYLIPTFQNPSGITMSKEKRHAIYEIAKKYALPIIEDNPYGELRFAGQDLPTLKSFDTEGLVIYCSTFSKILSAGMRVGFAVVPAGIASKMVIAKQVEDVHTNLFFQMLCYRYMTQYDLDAHIEKIRGIYRRKCGLMLAELDKEMPKEITFTRPEGGLFLWGTLPEGLSMPEFVKRALSKKVAVVPGTTFNCDPDAPSQSFRLNYSTPSDEQIVAGVRRLGEAAREILF